MCKRMFLLASFVLLLVCAPSAFAGAVGVFDFTMDIGFKGDMLDAPGTGTHGMGFTHELPSVWKDNTLVDRYVITAGGADIWSNNDGFHFAYRKLTGDVTLSVDFEGWLCVDDGWGKYGVMVREDTDADSVEFSAVVRADGSTARSQRRYTKGAGTSGNGPGLTKGVHDARITRIDTGITGWDIIESQYSELGTGAWKLIHNVEYVTLPDEVMVGVAVTSHRDADGDGEAPHVINDSEMAQQVFRDVQYDVTDIRANLITEFPEIPGDNKTDPAVECSDLPGFSIYTVQSIGNPYSGTQDEKYAQALELLLTGMVGGDPSTAIGNVYGTRRDPVVNLHDTGGRGAFSNDSSYPGIDPFEQESGDPAGGDDEDNTATLITACIELTAGWHVIGGLSDDGLLIEIGGVEIGRTPGWNATREWLFYVEEAGTYSFRGLSFEGNGGAHAEIYERLADGTRILLGDPAAGGSPVFVPEPATIALLGFGGLSMLRIRRKR